MSKSKPKKYRSNMKGFVDADYKRGVKDPSGKLVMRELNEEELEWYEKFENEYYSNAVGNKDSIHRQELSEEDFDRCKKETYNMTNAQNRDLYGIASTSRNYLKFIDDEDNNIQPESSYRSGINKIEDPNYAFSVFLEETIDEIESGTGRDLKTILTEFGKEAVKLGASLRPDKISTALKRAKAKKEREDAKK